MPMCWLVSQLVPSSVETGVPFYEPLMVFHFNSMAKDWIKERENEGHFYLREILCEGF
jgi:hypothetical protein